MVRTSTNELSEDTKKDATKKRNTSRKKTTVTGVWPCKINGCNKQFAREADLKRHQRTTKVHSMPGFACPQCDATFTRTDALRRHQKSRHNGVVIEPSEQDLKLDGEDGSSQSHSNSRGSTPSSKSKDGISSIPALNPPYTAQNNRPALSSYYRQHTVTNSGPYVPRPPITDPQCSQIGLPTSATRLNLTTHWGYPHSWPGNATQQMSYHQVYYTPHYRPNGDSQPTRPVDPTGPNQQQHNAYVPSANTQSITPPSCPRDSLQDVKPPQNDSSRTLKSAPEPSMASINSTLDSSNSTTLTREQVLEITQVAMKAVLEAEAERSSAESRSTSASTNSYPEKDRSSTINASEKNANNEHRYGITLERPEPMEHMLTEDGEPMLNPAELLTQESLASPPPT